MDFNEIKKEIHQNSVNHGFWEEPDIETKFALMHAELGEAMGEYQHGRPMVWHGCIVDGDECEKGKCDHWNGEGCAESKSKPEGIAVELVDCCIRIIDFMEYANMTITGVVVTGEKEGFTLSELVNSMHVRIASGQSLYFTGSKFDSSVELSCVIQSICYWIDAQGVDFRNIILKKHEYNKTRPYLHGKRC